MKLLSIVVPCYNSSEYMHKSIESALHGGHDVEIIIVNDGSTDNTLNIARGYEKQYPTIVKVIDQQNKGHGGAVNSGIAAATGLFLKILDSDDMLDAHSLDKILELLSKDSISFKVDMIITNYVYDKQGASIRKRMSYARYLPIERNFGWDEFSLPLTKYLLMHSITVRLDVVRKSNVILPEHSFYVDTIYVYELLKHIKTMHYIDTDFYMYFIGRQDQSVNEQVMIKRFNQQWNINKLVLDYYVSNREQFESENLRKYMLEHLEIITAITSILLIKQGTEESLEKKKQIWEYIEKRDSKTYIQLKRRLLGFFLSKNSRICAKISAFVYQTAQRYFGFN